MSSVGEDEIEIDRVHGKLKLYFAILSCLGGLILASGDNTESIMFVAIFFSIFGYVFVDWLQLFALAIGTIQYTHLELSAIQYSSYLRN